MNIGIEIKALVKGKAGIARHILSCINALARYDKTNTYFLFENSPLKNLPVAPNLIKIPIHSPSPGTIWLQAILPHHLKKHGIDVLWCPEHIAPVFPFSIRTPVVLTVHDLTYKHFPESMQPQNYVIFKLLFRRSLKAACRIIAISDYTRTDLLRCYGSLKLESKTTVVYNAGPEWTIPASKIPLRRKDYLLYVGSTEPRKNLIRLLEAIHLLKRDGQSVPVRIIGPAGWKNAAVYDFISRHNLDSQITFGGYCPDENLAAEYLNCKALIYPSLLEGFGIPVLEALATDTLVLTSRGTVMEEIGGKAVMLFNPRDPADIAQTIRQICAPGYDRRLCLRHAPEVLRRFTSDRLAQEHIKVFEEASLCGKAGNLKRA